MQAWQMANQHRQVQLKGVRAWQHAQGVSFLRRNRDLLAGRRFTESGMFNLDTFVHDHINTCVCQYLRCFLTDNAQLHPDSNDAPFFHLSSLYNYNHNLAIHPSVLAFFPIHVI